LRYWLNLPNALSLVISTFIRILFKVVADFTLFLHARHPYEVGGLMFSWMVVQNQVGCFVAARLYLEYYNGTDDAKIDGETLFGGLGGVCGLFIVSALAFISLMDRNYLWTFFCKTTGIHYSKELLEGCYTEDEQLMTLVAQHPSYSKDVKDDLKAFVDDNWDEWMDNRPEWLTDAVIESIPDEYLRDAEVKRLEKEGGGRRRRSSMFGGGGGGGGDAGNNNKKNNIQIHPETTSASQSIKVKSTT